jgi:NADPH-dependent curcumin reductase CurA
VRATKTAEVGQKRVWQTGQTLPSSYSRDIQSVRVLLNKDCSNVRLQVLKKEFPRGVDIIYESVGGETFYVCLNALAVYGRLIVIGMISQVYF